MTSRTTGRPHRWFVPGSNNTRYCHRHSIARDPLPSHRRRLDHLARVKAHHQLACFVDFDRHVVVQPDLVGVRAGIQQVGAFDDPVGHGAVGHRSALPQIRVSDLTQRHSLALATAGRRVGSRRDILCPHELDVHGVAAVGNVERIRREAQHMATSRKLKQVVRRVGLDRGMRHGRVNRAQLVAPIPVRKKLAVARIQTGNLSRNWLGKPFMRIFDGRGRSSYMFETGLGACSKKLTAKMPGEQWKHAPAACAWGSLGTLMGGIVFMRANEIKEVLRRHPMTKHRSAYRRRSGPDVLAQG